MVRPVVMSREREETVRMRFCRAAGALRGKESEADATYQDEPEREARREESVHAVLPAARLAATSHGSVPSRYQT